VNIRTLDPLRESSWSDLVARHPAASVFHEPGWIEALVRTYEYEPLVLTSTPPGEPLRDGLVFCRVKSWITGTRLVSLPFADHCDPLLEAGQRKETMRAFKAWLHSEFGRERLRYVELRLRTDGSDQQFKNGQGYCLHTLDLDRPLAQVFSGLHRDCMQRRIRHAERMSLKYETGDNQRLLHDFYSLVTITRRRHALVPQPYDWFRNLLACMGDKLQIRLARKDGIAIAAVLTLTHRSTVVYKYGCSDARYHRLAGMPFLFWKLIEESKAAGAGEIDLGRSDLDNNGLIVFKDHLGARKTLHHYLVDCPRKRKYRPRQWVREVARRVVPLLPSPALPLAGRIMYRHVG